MRTELREKAIQLRTKNRLSYSKIQKILNVPKTTLSYWLREYPLAESEILELRRASWLKGEASRERFRNAMREKRDNLDKTVYDYHLNKLNEIKKESFFTAGLMLYLGEGDKRNRNRVGLANTDPNVIKFFIKWIKDFLKIDESKIHLELHLYENMDIEAEKIFWQKITGLTKHQFYKTQIRKIQNGKFKYESAERHGTCSIIFASSEKKREIMMAIKALINLYLRGHGIILESALESKK